MTPAPAIPALAAILASTIAAWTDHRTDKIPNWLTFPIILEAPVLWTIFDSWQTGLFSIIGAVICMIPPMLLQRKRLGGGDFKILSAIGAILLPIAGLGTQCVMFLIEASLPIRARRRMGPLLLTAVLSTCLPRLLVRMIQSSCTTSN